MKKFLLLTMVCSLMVAAIVNVSYAQERTVSGKVTSAEDGSPLPGVNVVIKGTTNGTITDGNGEFQISVPSEGSVLILSFIGLETKEVTVGSQSQISVELSSDITALDEVVVTGVASGTSTKTLGFSVGKVKDEILQKVPASDPGNALRGKLPGVRIVQPSGNPTTSPEIRLRGSTSISGSQRPLIIIDGIITDGNLKDINMEDVESIEVVKGAAASSLYGSLAGNGVIQIITKRGAKTIGKPVITLRNEYGFSDIQRDYPLATTHPFQVDGSGNFILDAGGNRILDTDFKHDNEYPVLFDNVDNVYTNQPYYTNYASLSATESNFNYHLSFQNHHQGGVLENLPPYERRNTRLNLDYIPSDKITLKVSASYSNVDGVNVTEQGQNGNFFYSVLTAEPFIDLTEKDPETGNFSAKPTGYEIQGSNWQNPLYVAGKIDFGFERRRIISGFRGNYEVNEWLSFEAGYSLDETRDEQFFFVPKDFATPSPGSNQGEYNLANDHRITEVSDIQARFKKSFSDFNLAVTAKFLYEDRNRKRSEVNGEKFSANGVKTLDNLDQSTLSAGSFQRQAIAQNFFLDVSTDYQEKIMVSGLIRRDGSSLFGANERWQTFGRGSVAYRITEDFEINGIEELKIRASYGTSGQRPRFEAQYETYNATQSGISPAILGNKDLLPSTVKELEVGIDVSFLNRFYLEVNYADADVENDFILVPLSSVAGFTHQWQNVGNINSTALEIALGGTLINNNGLTWDLNLNWDKVTQEITELGLPDFTRNTNSAVDLFRVEEGLPYGAMYGNQIITSVNQLTVDEDGFVINDYGTAAYDPGTLTTSDFTVNSDGYVVIEGTEGTADEQVIYLADENGEVVSTQIGDTNPDFNVGLSSNLSYKGLSLYFLLDYQKGGDIYNYTKQLLYYNDRHADLEDYAEAGKHINYSNAASKIYNLSSASSHFVEDGSYAKIRELSLSYTIKGESLGSLGNTLKEAQISLTGRNLFTFTDYSGWDPEVALGTNPTNFRLDEYAYPNYRTFTVGLSLKF